MSIYSSLTVSALLQAAADQDRAWVSINTMGLLENELRDADISTDATAAVVLENLQSIVTATPYQINDGTPVHNTDVRFGSLTPGGAVNNRRQFAALFRDGWQRVFRLLTMALSSPTTDQPTPPERLALFDEAMTAFGANLRNGTGVYNGLLFEQEYGLVWGPP